MNFIILKINRAAHKYEICVEIYISRSCYILLVYMGYCNIILDLCLWFKYLVRGLYERVHVR